MARYKVNKINAGTRLDIFIASNLNQLSRSFIKRLDDDGKVTVNGKVEKPSYKLKAGDKIVVNYDEKQHSKIPEIDLPVLYEDNDVLVVNKPVGVLTHSKGAFNPEGTVATFIGPKLKDMDGERGGIVHRLDRATSGVIITAKNSDALSWLQKQFSQRKTKKTYIAIVSGQVEPKEALIDMPIQRNPKKPQTFRTNANGKPATTNYKVLAQNDGHSLLELKPLTGRTHQLRVHLEKIGHPIVGDSLYGGEIAKRMMLHATTLEITLPSKERKIFEAPLPKAFSDIIKP